MAGFPVFLQSRVARRFLLLIGALVLIPVLISGAFTYWSVSTQAQENANRRLREAAKGFALETIGRLELASQMLRTFAATASAPSGKAGTEATLALGPVLIISPEDSSRALPESMEPAIRALLHSATGPEETSVVFVPVPTGPPATYLIQQMTTGDARGRFAVVEVLRDYLWGTQDVLPSGYQYCVMAQRSVVVFCSQGALGRQLEALRQGHQDALPESFTYVDGDDHLLAATWSLPTVPHIANLELDVAAGVQEEILLTTVIAFRRTVPPALVLTLLSAVWIAIILVRRRMRPLDELVIATDRLARGDFSSGVQVQSDDEFAGVGRAFNSMQGMLGRQFAELGAFSKLDRLILERGSLNGIVEDAVADVASLQPDGMAAIALRDLDAGFKSIAYWTDGGQLRALRGEMDPTLLDQLQASPGCSSLNATSAVIDALGLGSCTSMPTRIFPIRDGDVLVGAVVVSLPAEPDVQEAQEHLVLQFANRLSVAAASIRQRERLYALGHFDELTGLPNRQLFKERLNQAMTRMARTDGSGFVLYIDLDRFKQVNDAEGHRVGDRLLAIAGERIAGCVREVDTVARLGGDEFTVLVADGANWQVVEEIGQRIVDVLKQPFRLHTLEYFIAASVGVARFPQDGETLDLVLRNADLAMYAAKDSGGGRLENYQESMQALAHQRVADEVALRYAIEHGEMCLHYQPQVEVKSDRIAGVEALIRWNRPGVGLVSPAAFIPTAERTGLIRELGAYAMERACHDFVAWRTGGLDLDSMSVNVSLRELKEPGFEEQLAGILKRTGMPRHCLELEITESVLAEDMIRASERLRRIHALGVAIAIDDFGTGYSSFTYLREFPVDTLKIDRTFIQDVPGDAGAASLLESIIEMARKLGKRTVAEGIETPEQAHFLKKCECTYLQGYLFARPLPEAEFVSYVRTRNEARLQNVA